MPGAQPPTIHTTRSFAMLHAAIFDAVNSISRAYNPYLTQIEGAAPSASKEAAAAAAAHEVLINLYPGFQSLLDTQLEQSLASVADEAAKAEGVQIGQMVANRILQARSQDGANAPQVPFIFGTAPGDYQSTPPNFPKQPQLTQWPGVTPFALEKASQFRPGPPPALTSDTYTNSFNEVKSLGISNSATATPDQAVTGRFWNGAIQNYWNEIAQTAALDRKLKTAETARLFALLNLSLADSVIAFYDAKYTYRFWRPVTAIRKAATDGNPETTADPNWLPETGNTAPDPSYPGAHAVISAAGSRVLIAFFGDHFDLPVTSETLPGVTRSFRRFSDASREATFSRIFAGQHFRFDLTAGRRLGNDVAGLVLDHQLERRDDVDSGADDE
jgi:PAP2 superfamily